MAGSPEVKALGDQVDTEPPRSDQPRGQATRRAVSKENGTVAENWRPRGADLREYGGDVKKFPSLLDDQSRHGRTGEHVLGLPAD